jgi:hypothetical protein
LIAPLLAAIPTLLARRRSIGPDTSRFLHWQYDSGAFPAAFSGATPMAS